MPVPDRLLTVDELAEVLQVSKAWIYERTSRGTMPFIKVGHFVRFDRDEVMSWAKSGRAEEYVPVLRAIAEP